MKRLDGSYITFGRHETFPLRYAWLSKGLTALQEPTTAELFRHPEQAMVEFGVGRNMVSAIHYWLRAAELIEPDTQDAKGWKISELGQLIYECDRYLEDEATLWLIHWLIAANASLATGFFWFFNHFSAPRFNEQELERGLQSFTTHELQNPRSSSTLKSDASTLLRMYSPNQSSEDQLDSPLGQLCLLERDQQYGYRCLRTERPLFPSVVLHFALAQRFECDPALSALPLRSLLYGGDGYAAPGSVFRFSEEGLMNALQRMLEQYPGCYELRDTAGLHQLYRGTAALPSLPLLRSYYKNAVSMGAA